MCVCEGSLSSLIPSVLRGYILKVSICKAWIHTWHTFMPWHTVCVNVFIPVLVVFSCSFPSSPAAFQSLWHSGHKSPPPPAVGQTNHNQWQLFNKETWCKWWASTDEQKLTASISSSSSSMVETVTELNLPMSLVRFVIITYNTHFIFTSNVSLLYKVHLTYLFSLMNEHSLTCTSSCHFQIPQKSYPDFLGRLLFLTVYICVAKALAKLHQCSIHNERHWITFHKMLIKQQQTTPTKNTKIS